MKTSAHFQLNPERRLLGAVAGADWRPKAQRHWDADLLQQVDWALIPELAQRNKMCCMMAAALREAEWPGVPADVRAELERMESGCHRRAMLQWSLLIQITRAAQKASLRFLTLKGPALGALLFERPFLRESSDLDILVAPEAWERFTELLHSIGLEKMTIGNLSSFQERFLRNYNHHDNYIHSDTGVHIECHFQMQRNRGLYRTDFDRLWREHITVEAGGEKVPLLCREEQLHYLGVHGAGHQWFRWHWLADVMALVNSADENFVQSARKRAEKQGNQDLFDSCFFLTEWIGGYTLPPSICEQVENNQAAMKIARRAFQISVAPNQQFVSDRAELLRCKLRDAVYVFQLKRTREYIFKACVMRFVCENDWRTLRLPNALIWIHPIIYPFHVLRRMITRRAV